MGVGFPKEEREAMVPQSPTSSCSRRPSDMRYNWIHVRLDAIDLDELRELVIDGRRMCLPKSVAAQIPTDRHSHDVPHHLLRLPHEPQGPIPSSMHRRFQGRIDSARVHGELVDDDFVGTTLTAQACHLARHPVPKRWPARHYLIRRPKHRRAQSVHAPGPRPAPVYPTVAYHRCRPRRGDRAVVAWSLHRLAPLSATRRDEIE